MKLLERLREKILPKRYGSVEWKAWKKHYKGTSLLKLAHSLEKGLGLAKTVPGRGKEKAQTLLSQLQKASKSEEIGFDFLVALHTLSDYVTFQKEYGEDVDLLAQGIEKLLADLSEGNQKVYASMKSGPYVCTYDSSKIPNVEEVFRSRHSVRDFDLAQDVTEEEFMQAVKIAGLAPSACNRQPCRVYYTLDRECAKKCIPFIPGIKGFETNVPYFAVITVDRSLFDLSEIYQWFVNGGIYLAYFINALNGVGVGSCVFQFPFNIERSAEALREMIGASEEEAICAIVGFGKKKESYKAIYAQRKDPQSVVKEFALAGPLKKRSK